MTKSNILRDCYFLAYVEDLIRTMASIAYDAGGTGETADWARSEAAKYRRMRDEVLSREF